MILRFSTNGNPSSRSEDSYLVKCPDYCQSGFQIATWNGKTWVTDDGSNISKYVKGWVLLEEDE